MSQLHASLIVTYRDLAGATASGPRYGNRKLQSYYVREFPLHTLIPSLHNIACRLHHLEEVVALRVAHAAVHREAHEAAPVECKRRQEDAAEDAARRAEVAQLCGARRVARHDREDLPLAPRDVVVVAEGEQAALQHGVRRVQLLAPPLVAEEHVEGGVVAWLGLWLWVWVGLGLGLGLGLG